MIEPAKTRPQLAVREQEYPQEPLRGATPSSETSLRDFINILRRRKATALQTFIVVLALGAVATFLTKPLYRSTANLLVEGKASTIALNNTSDALSNLFLPAAGHDVSTQVEVLRSPKLFKKVCDVVHANPKDISLDVRQVRDTDVVELNVTSPSRDLAQRFATELPHVHLQGVKADRLREVKSALKFARRSLKEKNSLLAKAERDLERFKNRVGVANSQQEQTQDINAAANAAANVRQAEAAAAGAAAQLAAFEAARRQVPAFITAPTTTTNQEINALQGRIASLQTERQKLLFLYKPDQDEVRRVDVEIADLQRRLASMPGETTVVSRAPNPLIGVLDQNITEARATAKAAQASLVTARQRATSLSRGLARYNPIERSQSQLLRTIEDNRTSVASLVKSVEDLSMRLRASESKSDPITVIAAAGPAIQVAPRVVRNIVMALVLGLLLAAGAALLRDSLDDHVNNEEEARWLLDSPAVLGHLPLLPDPERHLISLEESDARILERFRVLRSNVNFTLMDQDHHSLIVTSTIPGEGKTSTASNLAIAMALDGRRIILVDADLRRPQLAELFGLPKQPGLTNVLVGQSSLQEALQDTSIPGLRLLTSGALPPNPAELMNSPAMDELLEAMKADSDMIIFDTPPSLATADAQVLSAKVDGVIYVMELGKIHKSAVQRSFELFHQAQARILGVVFNKMDQASSEGYGYYGYYDDAYYGDDTRKSEDGSNTAISKVGKKLPSHRAPNANGEVGASPSNGPTPSDGAANANGSTGQGDQGHAQVAGEDKQELL